MIKNLGPFLSSAWVDGVLRGRAYGISYASRIIIDREDTLEECKMMGVMYVQAVVDTLKERFPYLHVCNASKLSNSKYYPSDEEINITLSEQYLKCLIMNLD